MKLDVQVATPWLGSSRFGPEERRVVDWFRSAFYLDVGHACNQSCRYCFQDKSEARFVAVDSLVAPVAAARSAGLETVILVGGEPLIYPHLDELLEHLRGARFLEWGVMTNGRVLSDPARLLSLVDGGLRFCQMSFDTHRAAIQGFLARNEDLADHLLRALTNFGRHPEVALLLNAVVARPNVGHLSEIVRFIAELRQSVRIRPCISFTHAKPSHVMDAGLMVRAREAASAITEAVLEGERLGLPVFFRNLPFCVIDGLEHRSTDWYTRLYSLHEDGTVGPSVDAAIEKSADCSLCAHSEKCPGFAAAYAERFGTDEFRPKGESPSRNQRVVSVESPRLSLGAMQDGVPHYFAFNDVVGRLSSNPPGSQVLLVGPEPVLHPECPELVAHLADREIEVWLETTGIPLARERAVAILRGEGLSGIVWLHPHPGAPVWRKLLSREPPPGIARRVDSNCRTHRLRVEHLFPITDEPGAAFRRRVQATLRDVHRLDRVVVSSRSRGAEWGDWLGRPLGRSRALAAIRDDLAAHPPTADLTLDLAGEPHTRLEARSNEDGPHSASTGGPVATVSLLLGTRCSFRCEFCYLEKHDDSPSPTAALATIDRLLASGYRRFLLAGGEPTLYPHLLPVLGKLARPDVSVTLVTNGFPLADRRLVGRLRDAGLKNVMLSFHSHDPDVFAALVHTRSGYAASLQAFGHLLDHGFHITIHHVLYAGNYHSFPEFIRFYADVFHRPGRTEISVSNVLMVHPSMCGRSDLVPRLRDVRPSYDAGVQLAESLGFEVQRGTSADAFPDCVFGPPCGELATPPDARWIVVPTSSEIGLILAGQPDQLSAVASFGAVDYNGIFTHAEPCRRCVRRKLCIGIQTHYVALYGWDELQPF